MIKKLLKPLCILIILNIHYFCFAQANKDSCKYEIGIGIPSVLAMSKNLGDEIYAMNVSFKMVHHKNVFRSGISYEFAGFGYKSYTGLLFNAGYERRFFNKKSMLIAGVDLCYYHQAYVPIDNVILELPGNYFTFYHAGIGPVIGYIYRPIKKLSIQTECGFFWGHGERKYYDNKDNKKDVSQYKNNGNYFTIHRSLSLMIYYHF